MRVNGWRAIWRIGIDMTTDGAPTAPCEWEAIVATFVARVRRSRWAAEIRSDAESFREEGYAPDVALMKSAKYWLEGELDERDERVIRG